MDYGITLLSPSQEAAPRVNCVLVYVQSGDNICPVSARGNCKPNSGHLDAGMSLP